MKCVKQMKNKLFAEFHFTVSTTTIGNCLEGQMYTLKQVHKIPVTMISQGNKIKRAEYVEQLNEYVSSGHQIVWMDETNFNLFCRRNKGRSRVGNRAILTLPAARGPNIHLIGAISMTGVLKMTTKRGSFNAETANEWVIDLLHQWVQTGNRLEELVVVVDNAPCHSRIENVFVDVPAKLLRLGPYSPMLNPIENIWSKVKTYVKTNMSVPITTGPGICEQRV